MKLPPKWSREQLEADIETAQGLFREERLGESIGRWNEVFAQNEAVLAELLAGKVIDRLDSLSPRELAELFKSPAGDALRYIPGPPISHDDLKVLAQASLAPSRIAGDARAAARIADILRRSTDMKRFPWIGQGRAPTEEEMRAAILATAALLTAHINRPAE